MRKNKLHFKKTTSSNNAKVGIVGAGIAGTILALEFFKLGYNVTLFEKESLLNRDTNNFKSFNYTINYRGKMQLQKHNLWNAVLEVAVPLYGRIHHSNKRTIEQKYGLNDDAVLYSITRSDLLRIVSEKLYKEGCANIIEHSIIKEIFINDERVLVTILKDKTSKTFTFDFIVGADGANSQVRNNLNTFFQATVEKFSWNYIQRRLDVNESCVRHIENTHIHLWPNDDFVGIGIPNKDSSISLLHIFKPFEYKDDIDFFKTINKQTNNYYIPNLNFVEQNQNVTLGTMLSVKSNNWHINDKVILVGDAAHSIYPFLGQGMNAALQDVNLLCTLLRNFDRCKAF